MSDIEITGLDVAVAANPWKPWIFVRVGTDAGVTGYGEATGGSPENTVDQLERMRGDLLGADPFDTARLFTPYSPVGGGMTARSAIDIALWDIKARHLGVPLYELLGGEIHGTELRSYANGWYTDVYEGGERRPELFAAAAEEVVTDGYDAMKFDPFGNNWRRMDRTEFNRSIECVRAVREAVGPDVDLLIEGHKRFSVPMALEVARDLEPYSPAWFEEPTPHDDNAIAKVAAQSPVPIATGESIRGHRAFADLLHESSMGIVQADVIHTGGITQLQKIGAMADAEHVDMAPHMASGWITLAASMHLDTTMPNFMIQENFVDYAFPEWGDEVVEEPIEIRDGNVIIPDRPGLGVDLDWEAIHDHAYEDHRDEIDVIDLYAEQWEERADVNE